jgi:benzoyl-CoA reductase/2-hydroxyglutaryl-CoA dehydratase subunit BcrC/BadD/HgdB
MELKSYFDSLVDALAKKIAERKTARRLLGYETGRIGQKLFDPNYASAWTGVFIPFEILQAMDVGAVFIEFVGAMLAGTGQSQTFLREAEHFGYPADGCGYHRALIGAATKGLLGKPDLLIGATTPCDGGLKTILNLAKQYNMEPFVLDIPYAPVTREKIEYLTSQYRGMMDYIERKSGKRIDEDRLKLTAKYSNAAAGIIRKLYKLCMQTPAPINSEYLKNFQIVFALLMGSREGIDVAETFLEEARVHAENGCADLPTEYFRLLWVQNRIQFKNNLLNYLQEKFGAKIVIDELNYIYWDDLDEDNPLEGLAVRQIEHPLNGTIERRLDLLRTIALDYGIDGAINPSHWGCRQNCGARLVMKEELQRIGVPFINLDVDCIDPTNYSEGQILTRLQSFMEMIED